MSIHKAFPINETFFFEIVIIIVLGINADDVASVYKDAVQNAFLGFGVNLHNAPLFQRDYNTKEGNMGDQSYEEAKKTLGKPVTYSEYLDVMHTVKWIGKLVLVDTIALVILLALYLR